LSIVSDISSNLWSLRFELGNLLHHCFLLLHKTFVTQRHFIDQVFLWIQKVSVLDLLAREEELGSRGGPHLVLAPYVAVLYAQVNDVLHLRVLLAAEFELGHLLKRDAFEVAVLVSKVFWLDGDGPVDVGIEDLFLVNLLLDVAWVDLFVSPLDVVVDLLTKEPGRLKTPRTLLRRVICDKTSFRERFQNGSGVPHAGTWLEQAGVKLGDQNVITLLITLVGLLELCTPRYLLRVGVVLVEAVPHGEGVIIGGLDNGLLVGVVGVDVLVFLGFAGVGHLLGLQEDFLVFNNWSILTPRIQFHKAYILKLVMVVTPVLEVLMNHRHSLGVKRLVLAAVLVLDQLGYLMLLVSCLFQPSLVFNFKLLL
jgi:hypothetical protein